MSNLQESLLAEVLKDETFMWRYLKQYLWNTGVNLSMAQCNEAAIHISGLLASAATKPEILKDLLEEQSKENKFYSVGK